MTLFPPLIWVCLFDFQEISHPSLVLSDSLFIRAEQYWLLKFYFNSRVYVKKSTIGDAAEGLFSKIYAEEDVS